MTRSVIVTGASSGIGKASALRLARAGWGVYGGVRNAADADVLREHGVVPLELDVTDAAQRISQETAELYAERIERFKAVALKRGPGVDPDAVAKSVEHALTASRPKARYVVGRDARLRAWIEGLPTRLRDRILAKALLD